jgi:hypothetical protein
VAHGYERDRAGLLLRDSGIRRFCNELKGAIERRRHGKKVAACVQLVKQRSAAYSPSRMSDASAQDVYVGFRIPRALFDAITEAQERAKKTSGYKPSRSEVIRTALERQFKPKRASR